MINLFSLFDAESKIHLIYGVRSTSNRNLD